MADPESTELDATVNRVMRLLDSLPAKQQKSLETVTHSSAPPPPPIDPSLCFIRHIPPELLLRIFSDCKYFDTDTSRTPWWMRTYIGDVDRPWPTVLALSHVCRAWKHITNSHTFLWTEILVDNDEWTELYLERSRDAVLHLSFDPFAERRSFGDHSKSEAHMDAALSTLKALDRVYELDICGSMNADALSVMFTAGEECALDMFLDGVAMFDYNDPEELIPVPAALRILSLRNFETNRYMRLFHAPLTSLSLAKVFCGSPRERLISPLVEILRQLPSLEHFDVTTPIYEEEDYDLLENSRGPHSARASLPSLRSLCVHDELPQALSLIESLQIPANVQLSLALEAWGEYDREEFMHESASQVPSYDPRLRAILEQQYSAAHKDGARFTRLNIMDAELDAATTAITIELSDPSSPPLPASVLLTVDCETYTCFEGGSKAFLRLLPSLPRFDGVRTLELYINMNEDGWKETSRSLPAITHLTVHTDHAIQSLLCADKACEEPLLPHLKLMTLDGCGFFKEWDEFRAFLRRRRDDVGCAVRWKAVNALFDHTREEERVLLDVMADDGFAPQEWHRPKYFQYETASEKDRGMRFSHSLSLRLAATPLPAADSLFKLSLPHT